MRFVQGTSRRAASHGAVVRPVLISCLLAMLLGGGVRHATAQGASPPDPFRFFRWPVEDVRAIGELGWEAGAVVGAAGTLVLAFMPRDSAVTADAVRLVEHSNPYFVRAVEEVGNVHAVRPVALMIFLGTLFTDDEHMQDAAFTSLEAVVFADITTRVLKAVFGRSRPWEGAGPTNFRPFVGGTSFPSGHTTVAFALVTPWVMYYPGPWTAGLYLVSAGTAATRILLKHHWLTDTLAGAAVGTSVGFALARQHLRVRRASIDLVPTGDGGPGLTLQVRF